MKSTLDCQYLLVFNLLAEVSGDDLRIEAGGLNHDQETVVAADQVTQVLSCLDSWVVSANQEKKKLPQLVKLTGLSRKRFYLDYCRYS